MTDQEAITRLKRGDIGGLAALVERYQVKAVRTAYLITQDRQLAEDVVQSAFLRVHRAIDHFDSQRPFAPWFLRIVANSAVQAARRNGREVSLDGDFSAVAWAEMIPDSAPSLDDQLAVDESHQAVRAALAALPPEQRAVVVLRYYLDLSDEEMSAQLDSPSGTIRWRLHEARKRLRSLLTNVLEPQER